LSEKLPPKKFFKVPENFAEATDAEIDAFAQSIMDTLFEERDREAKQEKGEG
jgi:hypothetical protein